MMRIMQRTMVALATAAVLAVAAVAAPTAVGASTTTITASITPRVVPQGTTVVARGATNPARAGITIALERRLPGNTWSARAFATTDGTGQFAIPIRPTGIGVYALRIRSAYGYSPIFYVRILGPLVLDPGGLPGLRLGMSLAQAEASHWATGTTAGCPVSMATSLVFQPGLDVFAEIGAHGITWIGVGKGGRTREGLANGALGSQIAVVYPSSTWHVTISAVDPMFGVKFFEISRNGVHQYSGTVQADTGRVSTLFVPYTPICD